MSAKTMNRAGYDVQLAAGTITAGGTLGILIPPSIMLVVMGPILNVPVTDLFAAAIMPGLMLAALYTGYTLIRCHLNPSLGPVVPEDLIPDSMREVWIEFFNGLVPPVLLVGSSLGSILAVLATPTEGAAMGAVGAIFLTLAYRKLNFKVFQEALLKTLEITTLIMILVCASNFFGSVFSRLGTPTMITEALMLLDLPPTAILLIVMALIFLLAWPLEWVPIVLIIIPIVLPLIEQLGFNLTWFAILVAVNLQTAWLSPPVALSAYFLKDVLSVKGFLLMLLSFGSIVYSLGPSMKVLSPELIFPLVPPLCWALYQFFTKLISGNNEPFTAVFYTAITGTIIFTIYIAFNWTPIENNIYWLGLVFLGVAGFISHFIIIYAIQLSNLSFVANFQYSQLVWSSIIGYLIFGTYIETSRLLGIAAIIVFGILFIKFELSKKLN